MGSNKSARKKQKHRHSTNLKILQVRDDARKELINAVCGRCDNQSTLDGGLRIFLDFIQERILACENATSGFVDSLTVQRPEGSYLDRQMEVTAYIANSIKPITPKTTLDELVEKTYQHFQVNTSNGKPHLNLLRHLIFAAIGWSTMLYTSTCETGDKDFATTLANFVASGPVKQSLEQSSQRPIGALLRNYGLMPITCPPGAATFTGFQTLLPVTHLNYFTLSRLGNVTISWVDDLTKHCIFDRYSKAKELQLFRWPSYCARVCLCQDDDTLVGRLSKSHICQHNCRAKPRDMAKAYMTEVLLSYRLIFGQQHRSRELFRKEEREKVKWNGALDPLLDALCGDKEMGDFGDTKGLLRERGVYDAQTNFPHLGSRLMDLQDYSSSQRPRNLIEVWNDEREPEKLLTFKAVIIVGGVSILLSLIQVFVGVAQVVLAALNN